MSYKNSEVWRLARDVSLEVHLMTGKLPKGETFEEGQQIRRSSKSVRSNIVEGYGRRYYKADDIKFLIYALASADETLDHLEILYETRSLTDDIIYTALHKKTELLNRQLYTFVKWVIHHHIPPKF